MGGLSVGSAADLGAAARGGAVSRGSQLNGGGYFFQVIARLRPGVSLEQAREAMNVIAGGYRSAHRGNVDAPSESEVVPLLDDAVGRRRQSYLHVNLIEQIGA